LRRIPPLWRFGATALVAAALIAGGFWNLSVVTSAKAGVALGNYALYRQRQPRLADKAYSEAAAADPYSPEPWQQRALVAFSMSQLVGDSDAVRIAFDQAVKYQTEALARDPWNHTATRALAQMYRRRYAQSRKPADAAEAVRWMRRTVALYPTRASLLAELAEAARLVEPTEEAGTAAGRALELHEINRRVGHPDKQLPEAVLKRMHEIQTLRVTPQGIE
jgi:tetratricopeptide (TPR) repeat protein